MIVGKAPLRVSFLGGGTDYPEFFEHGVGHVVGCSIQHSVYVVVNHLPKVAEQNIRFTYRMTESVNRVVDLKHPVLRAVLEKLDVDGNLNVGTLADVPGNSGLGSSSAFTVALLAALHRFLEDGQHHPEDIAREAIDVERVRLREAGGWQDQYHAAVGGLRHYRFDRGRVTHEVLRAPQGTAEMLSRSMLLLPLGAARKSRTHARQSAARMQRTSGRSLLERMGDLTLSVVADISRSTTAEDAVTLLARGMSRAWEFKVELAPARSTDEASAAVADLVSAGALSAKLCGAGGSGFLLIVAPPGQAEEFNQSVLAGRALPANVSTAGVQVWQL